MLVFIEWFSVGGKIVPATELQVRGIAVHAKRVAHAEQVTGRVQRILKICVDKQRSGAVCLVCKCADFTLREVGLAVAAERHVKIAFSVHAEQTVKAVSVQVQKHGGQSQFTAVAYSRSAVQEGMILCVKGFANDEIVTPVVVVQEQGFRLVDQAVGVVPGLPVEINQRTIGITQDVTLVTGVHEYRCAAHERLNQTVGFWQVRLQCVHDAAFSAHPFQWRTG